MSNQYLKASYDSRATRIIATTNDVDRDGEVVDPSGVKNFKAFMETNPVILWQHRHNENPIGKATGGRVLDDRIELDVEWAPTAMGQEVKALYDNGFMNSFSIGFIPRKSESKGGQFTWTEWELLEVSAVSIPANPMANVIRSAEKSGLDLVALKGMYGEAGTPEGEQTEDAAESPDEVQDKTSDALTINKETKMDDKTIDIEAERKAAVEAYKAEQERVAKDEELEKLRKWREDLEAKKAEDSARKQIKEGEGDNIKAKGGENYDGVNLNKAQREFANLAARRGPEHLKLADAPETKGLLKAFAEMQKSAMSTKDMTNSDSAGGYLNPQEQGDLMAYARLNSVALRRATVIPMASDYMRIPVENAKVTLGYTAEATEATETSATFTVAELTAKDLDGYADVAMHLEMDSAEGIAALLLDQFTEAYGQKIDSAVFAGTGDPVSGIFLDYGRSEVFDTGDSDFSEILVSNLLNAIGKLEKPRRQNAAWFAGRTALWTYIQNLTEDSKHVFVPNWSEDAQAAAKVLGYPAEETEYAPDNDADTAMAVFGDLSKFLIGSRLSNLTLFRDPYSLSTYHYVRYVFWTRVAFANPLPNSFVGVVTAS
jgi:HK97 family phage major capsid protein/HK97 family phage prohead protease